MDRLYETQFGLSPGFVVLTGVFSWQPGSTETLLPLRDSYPKARSSPPEILGTGMGVAAVWVIRGGVMLAFRSIWPLMGTTIIKSDRKR